MITIKSKLTPILDIKRFTGNNKTRIVTKNGTKTRALCRIKTMPSIAAKQADHRPQFIHEAEGCPETVRSIPIDNPPTHTNRIAVHVSFQRVFRYHGKGDKGLESNTATPKAIHLRTGARSPGNHSSTRIAAY